MEGLKLYKNKHLYGTRVRAKKIGEIYIGHYEKDERKKRKTWSAKYFEEFYEFVLKGDVNERI